MPHPTCQECVPPALAPDPHDEVRRLAGLLEDIELLARKYEELHRDGHASFNDLRYALGSIRLTASGRHHPAGSTVSY